MEDWQRRAAQKVEQLLVAEGEELTDLVAALGGVPVASLEDGCPVVRDPGGWGKQGTGPRCGVPVSRGRFKGTLCQQPAGQGTEHRGAGRCVGHGGAKRQGRAEGAWLVAHAFAGELECSPWEGLLRSVRLAAQKVAYTELVISGAGHDLELEGRIVREDGVVMHPDTGEPLGVGQLRDLSWWVSQNALWIDRLARYSKLCIDAGVAERLVQQVELEGAALGRVLSAALSELEGHVTEDVMAQVRGAMRAELLRIDSEQKRVALSSDPDAGVVDSTYREG